MKFVKPDITGLTETVYAFLDAKEMLGTGVLSGMVGED
jgi:hypothetical protein